MMQKKLLATAILGMAVVSSASASSYITGNLRHNTERSTEYTFELGHTFETGTTVLVEVAGDQTGGVRSVTDTTLGIEQMLYNNDNLWLAVGYHSLSLDGSSGDRKGTGGQNRPLIKVGYNFDNGLFVSHRARAHYSTNSDVGHVQNRYDTAVGFNASDYQFKLNTIYVDQLKRNSVGRKDDAFNTEWRVTRFNIADTGIDPFFEVRHEDGGKDAAGKNNDDNFGFVFGASYAF
ncbi:oligogalacturonate-specific porin KdgM family protein [Endozoicomonas lisbonensis]|uniref:Porin n=1 Tax=Endozoicomonas lisbonensis TaxID=3120522 RepID=A0ABV2SB39_9GAMM